MIVIRIIFFSFFYLFFATNTHAQTDIGTAVAQKVGVYVFPTQDQSEDQQEKDKADCYKWAVQQSGVDPINPPEVEAAPVDTGPDGSVVRGSAGGAAAGAAIGAISGDAGKGAAIGATAGAIRGARNRRRRGRFEQAASQVEADQTEAGLINEFKKAFSACLQGKGYTVQ